MVCTLLSRAGHLRATTVCNEHKRFVLLVCAIAEYFVVQDLSLSLAVEM
jgi:hypothetical protein